MANTYTQIYIHVVFAVEGRQSLIPSQHNDELQNTTRLQNRRGVISTDAAPTGLRNWVWVRFLQRCRAYGAAADADFRLNRQPATALHGNEVIIHGIIVA